MMPAFFDDIQIRNAIQSQALPFLENIATDDGARGRGLNRFERDDPPPYVSSTDSEELDHSEIFIPSRDNLIEEERDIMNPPLSVEEQTELAFNLKNLPSPGVCYEKEAKLEMGRIFNSSVSAYNPVLRRMEGIRRERVIARHYIKRRWKKLGVWNPEWGIPALQGVSALLNERPNDKIETWKWKWQQNSEEGSGSPQRYGQHLIARALKLRQGLHRGEHCPVMPRSHLEEDTSISQAESFIITRPWFMFYLELNEESTRTRRLPNWLKPEFNYSCADQVTKWWKERGDWPEKFNELPSNRTYLAAWKWRHESPSPEPEDLTPLRDLKESPLDSMDIDFTPSEVEALEAIRPPSPTEADLARQNLPAPSFGITLFDGPPSPKVQEEIPLQQHYCSPNSFAPQKQGPKPKRRRHEEQNQANPTREQPVRCSARIAALKRSIEPLSALPNASGEKFTGMSVRKSGVPSRIRAAENIRESTQETPNNRNMRPRPVTPPSLAAKKSQSGQRRGPSRLSGKTRSNKAIPVIKKLSEAHAKVKAKTFKKEEDKNKGGVRARRGLNREKNEENIDKAIGSHSLSKATTTKAKAVSAKEKLKRGRYEGTTVDGEEGRRLRKRARK